MESVPSLDLGPVTVHFGAKTGKYPDGNQVIVRGRDETVAFDTPQVANRLGALLQQVDRVILGHVHEDHMAGLHLVPAKPVHVHEADVDAARSWEGLSRHYGYPQPILDALHAKIERDFQYAPRPDAIGYADGAVWDLGGGVRVRALHFPGHTAGHCVLLVEPDGIAFIGDIDLSGFGPYYGDASSSLADFRRSLHRLRALPARAWITSHHRGVYTDRAAFDEALAAFAAKIDEREARLLQMLAAGPQTLAELVRQRLLYPPHADDLWIDCAEARSIGQHLEELLAAGRVRHDAGTGRYRLAKP
ncbi:MAG: MBL fold metallo-hydrolase [Burkholderiales bacterium]|nr:MBL fold metallo-hydrolase [Burkholderiales bacterium]